MRKKIKKISASLALLVMLLSLFPWSVLAASKDNTPPPPKEPYEKVIYQSGNWYNDYMDGQLIIGYTGDKTIDEKMLVDENGMAFKEMPATQLSLSSSTVLRGIYLNYSYTNMDTDIPKTVSVMLKDSRGNIYGPYYVALELSLSAKAMESVNEADPAIPVANDQENIRVSSQTPVAISLEQPEIIIDDMAIKKPTIPLDYEARMKPDIAVSIDSNETLLYMEDNSVLNDGNIIIDTDEMGGGAITPETEMVDGTILVDTEEMGGTVVTPETEIVDGTILVDTEEMGGTLPEEEIYISVDSEDTLVSKVESRSYNASFIAQNDIILKSGNYQLYVSDGEHLIRNGETGMSGAILVKGILNSAWQDYKKKLEKWELEISQKKLEEEKIIGNEEILISVENPEDYDTSIYQSDFMDVVQTATFELSEAAIISEIGFNMFNYGQGAQPGLIILANEAGEDIAVFQCYGASLGQIPNGIWITAPDMELDPGVYYLYTSKDEAAYYDENGVPDFYVKLAPLVPKQYDFTGTYRVDVKAIKASTLMGPVAPGGKPSFDEKNFELTVLDKGTSLEVIGKYQDMPFSQICKITSREENKVQAFAEFQVDLTNLPYKAKVSAQVGITLTKEKNKDPIITIQGMGIYERKASKNKGADYNTYAVQGNGAFYKKDLPLYVVAAITAQMGAAGNVPGPDGTAQAATGMLFPPLAALVAHVIQTALQKKIKEEAAAAGNEEGEEGTGKKSGSGRKTKLSVGEQAMADANASLGQGLIDKEEAKAWAILADAMGNTDEPDADPESQSSDYGQSSQDSGYDSGGDSSDYGDSSEESSEYGNESEGNGDSNNDSSNDQDYDSTKGTNPLGDEQNTYDQFTKSETDKIQNEIDTYKKYLEDSTKSADPNDPKAQDLHQAYKDYIASKQNELDSIKNPVQGVGEGVKTTRTVQLDHTGRTGEITYDDQTGEWTHYDVETGRTNSFDMNKYVRDVAPNFETDRKFIEGQRKQLEDGTTPFDQAMKNMVADQKYKAQVAKQLEKWRSESYGITPPAKGVGDVKANIDKLLDGMSQMTAEQVRDQAKRIGIVVGDRRTGATADESSLKSAYNEMNITNVIGQTIKEGAIDVTTGRTWAGMGGRIILAGVTGGMSEAPLSVAEAMINIKESIDKGESGTKATLKAIGSYVLGELGGEYLQMGAKGILKGAGYQINQEAVNQIGKFLSTPVSKLPSKVIGAVMGEEFAKAGFKESIEKATGVSIKGILGSSDTVGKNVVGDVADAAKFNKFQSEVASQVRDIKTGAFNSTPGNIKITKQQVLDSLNNPAVIRELKKASPGVQKAYQEAIDTHLYSGAKADTEAAMKNMYVGDLQKKFGPDAKITVELQTIRTPGKDGKGFTLNSDNDVTGKITVQDKFGNNVTVVEVKSNQIDGIYNKSFATQADMIKSDGTFNVAKAKEQFGEVKWDSLTEAEKLKKYSDLHGQSVTDVHTPESGVDYNKVANVTGRNGLGTGTSNVDNLVAGKGTLSDPGQLAQMETFKINKIFNEADDLQKALKNKEIIPSTCVDNKIIAYQAEAYQQLRKMGELTEKLEGAYKNMGYTPNSMSSDMKKAMEVVSNTNLSPSTRNLELQKLGFSGPKDLADKLSGRIESFQKLGTAKATGTGANKATQAVIGGIIKSYLNDNK